MAPTNRSTTWASREGSRFTAWETLAVRAKAPSCVALIARAYMARACLPSPLNGITSSPSMTA